MSSKALLIMQPHPGRPVGVHPYDAGPARELAFMRYQALVVNDRLVDGSCSSFLVLFEVERVDQINPEPVHSQPTARNHISAETEPWELPAIITGSWAPFEMLAPSFLIVPALHGGGGALTLMMVKISI